MTDAVEDWFVDAGSGDLHLVPAATPAIDEVAPLAEVPDDFDGDSRPDDATVDVGADELTGIRWFLTAIPARR